LWLNILRRVRRIYGRRLIIPGVQKVPRRLRILQRKQYPLFVFCNKQLEISHARTAFFTIMARRARLHLAVFCYEFDEYAFGTAIQSGSMDISRDANLGHNPWRHRCRRDNACRHNIGGPQKARRRRTRATMLDDDE
jgi:hypothetical protein